MANISKINRRAEKEKQQAAKKADKLNHVNMLRWGNEPHTLWAGCPASLAPNKIVKELSLVDWPTAAEVQERRQTRGGDR